MNVGALIRPALRRNRHWVRMRRIQREGAIAAFARWRLWARILDSKPVITDAGCSETAVEVHLLCCEHDYLCAMWALKTFYHFAQVTYPLAIHLQGWSPERTVRRLRQHFPKARIISQVEADAEVDAELRARQLLRLHELRRQTPFTLKLTDFLISCRAPRLLLLDSDVLFFTQPRYLIEWASGVSNTALFQRDPKSTYNITAKRALERFNVRLSPAINTGIAVVPRDAISLERCEDFLADFEVARPNGFVEQTLYALSASERLAVNYLPEDYLVSVKGCANSLGLTARHYAGPSRSLFTSEGLPALIREGFLGGSDAES